MTGSEALRIVELRAENIKRLRAAHVRPDGSIVTVSGPNGAGKSSLLDAIMMALGGKDAQPSQPIHSDASVAEVELDLGRFRVRRVLRRNSPGKLTIESADGALYRSPQAMLDGLLGDLTFDPLEFSRRKPAEQAVTLSRLANLDLSDLDQAERAAFERRTDLNRRVRDIEGRLREMPEDPDAPAEEVSASDLRNRMAEAIRAQRDLSDAMAEAEQIFAQLEEARRRLEDFQQRRKQSLEAMPALEAAARLAGDPDQIQADLAEIDVRNASARQAAERHRVGDELAGVRAQVDQLDAAIADARRHRAARIAESAMPLPELSLGQGEVLWRGLPLEQASQAERLRVAAAIGMALNPQIRVLLIRDGSLMDQASLAALAQMAEEHGYQVWLERVAESGEGVRIVIEDGQVVAGGLDEYHEPPCALCQNKDHGADECPHSDAGQVTP